MRKGPKLANALNFTIAVPDDVISDLRERLQRTRWTTPVAGAGWDRGMSHEYLRELASYWQDSYDWRAQESALNNFAHFRATVEGVGIHYIHERGKGPNPVPIVLTHGWPDSFYRMLKLIPLLTDPAGQGADGAISFDVIVPSLPGYGFSDKPTTPGMTTTRVADLWHGLMTDVLGYERYGAHGGDMGSSVSMALSYNHSDAVVAVHLTDVPYLLTSRAGGDAKNLSEAEQDYMRRGQEWGMKESAYGQVQSTKPQSLGPAANDSPVGLAAWIVPHWRAWSDCDGDVETVFSKDELLTNVMIYWVTETIESSFNLYYEGARDQEPIDLSRPTSVPTGFAIFPKDLVPAPRDWAERFFTVDRWTEMPRGGHFAAMEQPDLLAHDLRAFFANHCE
jgi:microsomal epoxide hydrolase